MNRAAAAGVAIAMVVGAWLRVHGLADQVVQDDEWHALHKLMAAGYGEILRSFGHADHSIPLTLFYKLVAETAGLDEVRMRMLQVACGVALVPLAAWLAWRATANAAVAALLAFLIAGAPYHVLYSRFARPYAITTLLGIAVLAALWRWRERRSLAMAALACALAALAAWLHPLSAIYPMAALLFLLALDAREARTEGSRRLLATLALGVAMGLAIVLPLAPPLLADLGSLAVKARQATPDAYTLFRVASLFAGGLPDAATAALLFMSAFGAWRFFRAQPELGGYALFAMLAPILAVVLLGADWAHQGHTFARYVFPAQVLFLFFLSAGVVELVRLGLRRDAPRAELSAAAAAAAAYLAINPAITQVRTLGAWYGNLYHHYDYVYAHNRAARYFEPAVAPRFYAALASLPEGSVTLIQAPFTFGAPENVLAHYALLHRQREVVGFLHDLCLEGRRIGEVPRDPRFRFRSFVFLGDREATLRSGDYLLLHREKIHGRPFREADRCLAELTRLYGAPMQVDARIAVFDLRRVSAARKLQ